MDLSIVVSIEWIWINHSKQCSFVSTYLSILFPLKSMSHPSSVHLSLHTWFVDSMLHSLSRPPSSFNPSTHPSIIHVSIYSSCFSFLLHAVGSVSAHGYFVLWIWYVFVEYQISPSREYFSSGVLDPLWLPTIIRSNLIFLFPVLLSKILNTTRSRMDTHSPIRWMTSKFHATELNICIICAAELLR